MRSGRAALVVTADQILAALALIELDGLARRIALCPPALALGRLPHAMHSALALERPLRAS